MGKILSVSIAAYNVEQYIETALKPFAREEYIDKVEVLVIDDGGSDNTLKIASKYADKYPDIFIPVHKVNGGWGSTVNYGISHATGKYFKQLDGDDYFNPDNLTYFIDQLEKCEADLVFTPFLTFEDGSYKQLNVTAIPNGLQENVLFNYEDVADIMPLAMHSCTFRTQLLRENEVKLIEKCFYTDIEFVLRAIACVETVAFIDRSVYQYRIARSGQSMSYPGVRKHYKEHLIVTKTMINFVKNLNLSPKKAKAVQDRVRYLINNQYSIFFVLKPTKTHKEELKEYDCFVAQNAENYYNTVSRYVRVVRKINFYGYSAVVGLRYLNHCYRLITRGY